MQPSPEWFELVDELGRRGGLAVLVFARALGCFAILPMFAAAVFPLQVRIALPIAMLPLAVTVGLSAGWAPLALSWSVVPRAGLEFLIGIVLSLPACVLFWAARGAGELIDTQTGASNQEVFTAMTNGNDGPAAQLFVQLAVLGFLASGGLQSLLSTLWTSYAALAPGAGLGFEAPAALEVGRQLLTQTVALATRVAMPLVALFLLVDIGLAMASRTMPQLPLMAVTAAMKSLLLAVALLVVLQAWTDYLHPPDLRGLDVLRLFRPSEGGR